MTDTISAPIAAPARPQGYLHGPLIDFLCLGGGSLPILCLLVMLPPAAFQPHVAAAVVVISHFVNSPHFMHSYQIFYADFARKAAPGALLRRRYLVAGVLVPAVMVAFFLWCVATADAVLMGKAANAMLFLVGWHYVKQGYGILIVESVLKKAFFDDAEKAWLRWNALTVWLVSWIYTNRIVAESDFTGLQYITLGLPDPVFYAAVAACCATTAVIAGLIGRKALAGRVPVNGLLAYLTSSYVWLVLCNLHVLLLIVVPVFHSLQYLAVVWRYQLNKEKARGDGAVRLFSGLLTLGRAQAAMLWFVWFGICLGATVFWVVPLALDYVVAYREDLFGPSMFLFMVIIFVNVHHYFLDNVMWRRENPDIKEHLFG